MCDESGDLNTSHYEVRLPMVAPKPLVPIKRKRGRPKKEHGKGSRCPKSKSSWSKKTKEYVRNLSAGKGVKGQTWSTLEKRKLLRALKQYSHQDWDSLCKAIPTRTKKEIQDYIHTLRGGEHCKSKVKEDDHLNWAPIESWLDMCSEMVHYEQLDLSSVLGRVFSMLGHFGSFPATDRVSSGVVPDYGKLYRYLAAILDESLSIPELSPLESAVMSDLMYGMGDVLRMCDNSLQRKVMCWKYKMLNYKFEYDDVKASIDRIRKALTNDFSDLQKDTNRSVSGLQSFNQPSTSSTQPSAELHPGDPQPSTSGNSQASGSKDDPPPRQNKKGRKRLRDWRRPIEKPRLFSMNPFCVPIRLLRLKPLPTKPVRAEDISLPGSSRQRSMSVSSVQSVTGDTSCVSLEKSIQSQANQAEDRNNIRQMTGLFMPAVARKNKKRMVAQRQASASTMSAIAASLARRIGSTTHNQPPVSVQSTAGTHQAKNTSSSPKAFRCVRLPGDKMALIPAHLNDPAILSKLPMREALSSQIITQPVSRVSSVPALRNQAQCDSSTVSLNSHPATTSGAATSSVMSAPGVRKMPPLKPGPVVAARSNQPDQAVTQSRDGERKRTHSAAQLESSNEVSAPVTEVSMPTDSAAQSDSQTQEARPVLMYAQILPSRRPAKKKVVTPTNHVTVTEIVVSPPSTGLIPQSTVRSKTVVPVNVVPQHKKNSRAKRSKQSENKDGKPKQKGKSKQNRKSELSIKVNQEGKSKENDKTELGEIAKQGGEAKQAEKAKGKRKAKQPKKTDKTLLTSALTSAVAKDASSVTPPSTTPQSKPASSVTPSSTTAQSKPACSVTPSSTTPQPKPASSVTPSSTTPQSKPASSVTPSSTTPQSMPAVVSSKPPQNGAANTMDLSICAPPDVPVSSRPSENGGHVNPDSDRTEPPSPKKRRLLQAAQSSYFSVSSICVSRPKKTPDNSKSDSVSQSNNEERNNPKDPDSSGWQSEREVPGVELTASRLGRIKKPSFRAILAQVASPGASQIKTVKSVSFDKNVKSASSDSSVKTVSMDVQEGSDQACPITVSDSEQSVSSESSAQPQTHALDLSKKVVGQQGPDPKPSTSSQNRKKKNNSKRSQSKSNNAPKSSPKKKTKTQKKEKKEEPRKLHQKRPNNFLANADISQMMVEVVTPEEAKQRMSEPGVRSRKPTLVELNNAPKSFDKDTVPMRIL